MVSRYALPIYPDLTLVQLHGPVAGCCVFSFSERGGALPRQRVQSHVASAQAFATFQSLTGAGCWSYYQRVLYKPETWLRQYTIHFLKYASLPQLFFLVGLFIHLIIMPYHLHPVMKTASESICLWLQGYKNHDVTDKCWNVCQQFSRMVPEFFFSKSYSQNLLLWNGQAR